MDSKRRTLLTTGAAAAAVAAAPRAFAQTAMPFYEKGNVRIHYQEAGSGFPLLIIPGGGLNSTIAWNREERAVQSDGGVQERVSLHHG